MRVHRLFSLGTVGIAQVLNVIVTLDSRGRPYVGGLDNTGKAKAGDAKCLETGDLLRKTTGGIRRIQFVFCFFSEGSSKIQRCQLFG